VNNQAKAILWIGLALIAVQLVQQWSAIKAIIFTPSTPLGGSGGAFGLPINPLQIPFSTVGAGAQFPGITTNPGATFPKIFPGPTGGGSGGGGRRRG
jgi:hypothetical protein